MGFQKFCVLNISENIVLKFAVKISIYKPMQIRSFKICGA